MASGSQNLTTYLAKGLAHRILNQTSLNGLSGTYAFSGSGEPWAGCDWVGLQVGDNVDKWQLVASDGTVDFRENDSGGANTSWSAWRRLVSVEKGTAIGSSTVPVYINGNGTPVTISSYDGNAATATKLSNTPNNTTTFLRGDNTWSNTLANDLYLSGAKALYINSTGAIAHNGSNLWIGATATNSNVFVGNLYLNGGLNGSGKRNRVVYLSLGASNDAAIGTNYPIVHKDAAGSSTNGIYVDSNGKTIAMSYSLSATVNAASVKNTFAYYSGTNAISSYARLRNIGSARYPMDIYLYNDSGNIIGEIWYDSGDATNFTLGRWNFLAYSPKSTADTVSTGKYEYFYLPDPTKDRTSNASYAIRTSKSSAYNVDTATHLSSVPNNTTTFYRGDKTWTNTISNEFKIVRTTTDWKTGATLTFNTTMSSTTGYSYIASYQTPTATSYNDSLVIVATGGCFIGGGEGAETIHQNVMSGSGTEDLYLCPDGSIRIYTGADSKTQRAIFDTSSQFYPATNNTGAIGTSGNKWANMYATTFHGALDGNAATATRINGNLAAATSDVNRNIWVSSTASADGIPNYISGFNMNPSTKVFTVPAGTRISASNGALYLGNSGNASWVYVQDICSQNEQKWKIHQNGNAEFSGTVTAPTFSGNATSATSATSATVSNYVSYALGRVNSSAAAILINPSSYRFNLFCNIYDSTSRSKDATNTPSFDCAVINLPWDWGGYNGQIAMMNTNTTGRMQIRSASHTDQGEGKSPRYTPNYGVWREVVTADKATQMGSGTQPVYINSSGQCVACTTYANASVSNATYLKDKKNGTASYLNYGDSGLAASAITWLCCWNGYEVRAISKAEMANAVDSSHKWVRLGGDTMTGQLYINYNQDVNLGQNGSLIIGVKGGENIALDGNEIMARNNGAASTLYINSEGGQVYIGSGGLKVIGTITGSISGNADTANYQNCVATNEIRYARNGNMQSAQSLWQGWAFAEGKVAVINDWRFGNGNGGLAPIYGSKVYNAVWNDFAEYRESDETEGGRVLVSDGSGKLVRATERLQPAARVISDTFGCSVGMSNFAKTPIGVAGRVLVHPYQNRNNYKVGDAVCAAPNGTADIMTREEIIQYPDRIIGIVDEIPEYEIWQSAYTNTKNCDGTGEIGETNTTDVPVNGRIWIYVK